MKVEAKHFYFIKDEFFSRIQDNQLLNNKENVFLIQNMFPILEEYIESKYMYQNKPIEITYSLQQEIETKANKILSLVRRGYSNLVFTNILEIEKQLLKDTK